MIRPSAITFLALFTLAQARESDFMRAYNDQKDTKPETAQQQDQDHDKAAFKVSREQDELAADVQELIQLETSGKVIKFLEEAEELMANATDRLEQTDTSGPTIAIETEIIEKIADAAKQKQQSSGGQGDGALMQMMQQMMQGESGQGEQQGGDREGKQPGQQGGEGQEADSDSANSLTEGSASGSTELRTLPKKSGNSGTKIPKEFQKALDAYNRGFDDLNR